jgi:hypothetical protein
VRTRSGHSSRQEPTLWRVITNSTPKASALLLQGICKRADHSKTMKTTKTTKEQWINSGWWPSRYAGERRAGQSRAGRLLLQGICKRRHPTADHCKIRGSNERAMDQQSRRLGAWRLDAAERGASQSTVERLLLQGICKRGRPTAGHCKTHGNNKRAMDQQSAACRAWSRHAGSHLGWSAAIEGRALASATNLQATATAPTGPTSPIGNPYAPHDAHVAPRSR